MYTYHLFTSYRLIIDVATIMIKILKNIGDNNNFTIIFSYVL